MRDHTKKTIAIILAIILAIGLTVGWIVWRKNVSGNNKKQQTQSQTAKPNKKTEDKSNKQSKDNTDKQVTQTDTSSQAIQTVIQYEHAARDWGTDANIDPNKLSKQDARQVLDQLRGSVPDQNPLTAFGIQPSPNAGPYATSYICQQDPNGELCKEQPTMRDWWTGQAWAYGSRWVNEPEAKADGTVIRVTGKVKAILLQDDDAFASSGFSALTPAWNTYDVEDEVTVSDGKIASVKHLKNNPWWIDPYEQAWNNSMGQAMNDTVRIAIPVTGDTSMNLRHDVLSPILQGPQTMGDLSGKVNWQLWDGIQMGQTQEEGDKMMQQCKEKYGDKCPLL